VLQLGGNVTFTGTAGQASITSSGVAAIGGTIDLGGAQRDFSINDDGTDAVDMLVSARIINGSLKKSGAGKLRLAAASSYAGGTTLSAGTLELAGSGALGTGPITLNGGQLNVRSDAAVTTFANALTSADATIDVNQDTIAGGSSGSVEFMGVTIGANRLRFTGANRSVHFTGGSTLTGGAIFENAVGLTVSGAIGQFGGAWGLTKEGAGTMTFDGGSTNTYTGTTRVNAGMLQLNRPGLNAVPAGLQIFGGGVRLMTAEQIPNTATVEIQNPGSTLDLNGFGETINTLNGAGGGVSLGAANLTVTQGTYGGIISGSGMVIQENPGGGTSAALVLNNAQTFTGGVLVNHGSVTFSSTAPRHVGTTLTGGTWGVYNGSSLNFNVGSILTNQANVTLSGAGSSFAKINGMTSNQGTLTITNGNSFATAGALANTGTVTVNTGSTITLNGTYTNGGVTTATGTYSSKGITNTTGTLTLSGPQSYVAGGQLNVQGGTTTLNTDAGSAAVFNLQASAAGGSLLFNSTQHLASLSVTSAAVLSSAGGATTSMGPNAVVTKGFSNSGAGSLDLTNNALVVDYSGAPGPTMTTVRAAVMAAYNGGGGHWTGPGLTSSVAATDPNTLAVGYGEASDVLGISGLSTAAFRGQTVDATAVLAAFTKTGDATLDGSVDFNDLVKLAQNYNVTDGARTWGQGDFTFDGNVDFNDLVKLAQNYNTSLPAAAAAIPGASVDFEADLARAFATGVPEPSGLAAIAAVASALALGRRRRVA
jgi:autotransporter-associated beta strand protein